MQQTLGARQVAVGREERDVGLARLRDAAFARALRGVGVDGVVEMRRRYKDDIASSSFYIREIPNACAFVTRRAAFLVDAGSLAGGVPAACMLCSAVSRLSESAARVWRVRVAAVAAAFSAVRTRPQRVFVFQRTCLSSRGPSWSLAALQHS